jgi:hypothetical protein
MIPHVTTLANHQRQHSGCVVDTSKKLILQIMDAHYSSRVELAILLIQKQVRTAQTILLCAEAVDFFAPLIRSRSVLTYRSRVSPRCFAPFWISLFQLVVSIGPLTETMQYNISNIVGGACNDPHIRDGNPVGPFKDEEGFSQQLHYPNDPVRRSHDIVSRTPTLTQGIS